MCSIVADTRPKVIVRQLSEVYTKLVRTKVIIQILSETYPIVIQILSIRKCYPNIVRNSSDVYAKLVRTKLLPNTIQEITKCYANKYCPKYCPNIVRMVCTTYVAQNLHRMFVQSLPNPLGATQTKA